MSVCMSAVSAGISEVLIKYTGNVWLQIYFTCSFLYAYSVYEFTCKLFVFVIVVGICVLQIDKGLIKVTYTHIYIYIYIYMEFLF